MIIKFPYNASRRVYSRKPRISKNGTPEERAAKAAAVRPDPSTAPNVVQLSRKPVQTHTPPTPNEQLLEIQSRVKDLDPQQVSAFLAFLQEDCGSVACTALQA